MPNDALPRIVAAIPGDVDAILALVRAAYAKWVPVIGREPRPMTVDYATALLEHQIDLLVEDHRLLGLIETTIRADHLWIENLAIAPTSQGLGHGRRLLVHAEHLARDAGRSRLSLLTNAAFESNVRLYQRVGYVIDRSEPFMGGTTLYLSKAVPAR